MDQQFDDYKRALSSTKVKFGEKILPSVDQKLRKRLILLATSVILFGGYKFYKEASMWLPFIVEFGLSSLYFFVFPLMLILSGILLLVKKKIGWITLVSFAIYQVLLSTYILINNRDLYFPEIDSGIVSVLNELIGVTTLELIWMILIYAGLTAYLFRREIQDIYKIERKSKLFAAIGVILLGLIEYLISKI